MSRRSESGDETFGTVRSRYQQWRGENPRPRGPSALGFPTVSEGVARMAGTAVGLGTGAFLLLLAATAFVAAGTWGDLDRGGAAVAYTLTAIFLTVAGLGCILATWNHVFRVLTRSGGHH